MVGETAHTAAQLAGRAGLAALACLAFALGSGTGAFLASAQRAGAPEQALLFDAGDQVEEAYAAALRGPDVPAEVPPAAVAEAPAPSVEAGAAVTDADVDVHTVARALSVQPPLPARTVPRAVSTPLVTPAPSTPPVPAAPVAALTPGQRVPSQVTFYYCSGPAVGDGGGFCGRTADGTPVQIGVAACARAYMGQQFRVVGDPSGIIFRCADTGGGVHAGLRDMWFPTAAAGGTWLAGVGHQVIIEILE